MKKQKSIFISGKITGENIVSCMFKFSQAMLDERVRDYEVVINPLTHLGVYFGIEHDKAMEICLKTLDKCDAIYMLRDWKKSKGAQMEHQYAKDNSIKIIYQ